VRPRAEVEIEALYRRYRGDVYRYALRASRDENEADEVTQAAFLSAYRALSRGGFPRSPRAWLLKIAENVRKRRLRRPREVPLPESYEAPAPEPDVTAGELVAAIQALPDSQRRVLLLRELGGRSYGEIADELETSVGSVQMLLFRARRELRDRLKRVAGVPAPLWPSSWWGGGAPALRAGAAAVGAVVLAFGAGGAAAPDGPVVRGDLGGLLAPALPAAKSAAQRADAGPRPIGPQPSARAEQAGPWVPGAAPGRSPQEPAAPLGPVAVPASPQAAPLGPVAVPASPQLPSAPAPVALPQPTAPIPLSPVPGVEPPVPGVEPPALPQLPPVPSIEPSELPPLPPVPSIEPPALPTLPRVPEAPALPELGGAQLP
jgi:RNA polymerase sigma factor (sigma-70 family)